MRILRSLWSNQKGVSLPLVIVLTSVAISSIGYVALTLLPKLQDGKKKAEQAIQYRIFLGSLNDYIVHGIRERWCVNVKSVNSGIVETDFLLSNECASTKPMEDVVTYPGNLERLLWNNDTIGMDGSTNGTEILGLNYKRRNAAPPKTTRLLTHAEVALPPDHTMRFQITETVMNDMTNEHPLFTILSQVRNCFDYVDVEVSQIVSGFGAPTGEERKFRIFIKPKLKLTPLSCLANRVVESTSFYTMYPRRLHNFALIKYGDLDATNWNEFYGPVYVAGHLRLPSALDPKSTIFYDTLTLGTYNGGNTSTYYGGKVVDSLGQDYTFSDYAHPTLSKQDKYETFRGILGGLRLDAVEDKGLYNLFDYSNTSNADVATLEACIDENKIKTTPSMNNGSVLGYNNPVLNQTSSPGIVRYKIGLTKKNRFKLLGQVPAASPSGESASEKFIVSVPTMPNGSKSLGALTFKANDENIYSATMGDNSSVEIKIDFSKFALDTASIDAAIALLSAPTTKLTYADVIPSTSILRNLSEYTIYKTKAEDLITKCDADPSIAHCAVPLAYVTVCDHTVTPSCDQTTFFDAYTNSKNALITKLNAVKSDLTSSGDATMTLSIEPILNGSGKLVINHKIFQAAFTTKWKNLYPLIEPSLSSPTLKFESYHYGLDPMVFMLSVVKTPDLIKLRQPEDSPVVTYDLNSFSGWKNMYDNSAITSSSDTQERVELSCPTGMGLADWDLDMSASSNFAWNYANQPGGVSVDTSDHSQAPDVIFANDAAFSGHISGTDRELTTSVADNCTIKSSRKYIYGFYVCKNLLIESRSVNNPLTIVGTFIVQNLINNSQAPVNWHSFWTDTGRDLVLTELNATNSYCATANQLVDKTMLDIASDATLASQIEKCSSQERVSNGPNNFTWSTVDPEIGIAPDFPAMTSQKVKRVLRWVTREDSTRQNVK